METISPWVCGQLVIELDAQTVAFQDREICLTSLEFKALFYLVRHPGQYVRAEILLEQVWHCEAGGTPDQVKSCIKRLRRKLGAQGAKYIQTHWGFGYRFAIP